MTAPIRTQPTPMIDDETIAREACRILRRMAEPGAVLAIAPDLENAVVLRQGADGKTVQAAVVGRQVAQAFALKDWIVCRKPGRIATYDITPAGRMAVKRMMDAAEGQRMGMAEAAMPFAGQHREWATREVAGDDGPRRVRYNAAESPVAVLARRRDKDGKPFLEARSGGGGRALARGFRTGADGAARGAELGPVPDRRRSRRVPSRRGRRQSGPPAARDRVAAALRDLGPGSGGYGAALLLFSGRTGEWPNSEWVGRHDRARSCCALLCNGCNGIMRNAMGDARPLIG